MYAQFKHLDDEKGWQPFRLITPKDMASENKVQNHAPNGNNWNEEQAPPCLQEMRKTITGLRPHLSHKGRTPELSLAPRVSCVRTWVETASS